LESGFLSLAFFQPLCGAWDFIENRQKKAAKKKMLHKRRSSWKEESKMTIKYYKVGSYWFLKPVEKMSPIDFICTSQMQVRLLAHGMS